MLQPGLCLSLLSVLPIIAGLLNLESPLISLLISRLSFLFLLFSLLHSSSLHRSFTTPRALYPLLRFLTAYAGGTAATRKSLSNDLVLMSLKPIIPALVRALHGIPFSVSERNLHSTSESSNSETSLTAHSQDPAEIPFAACSVDSFLTVPHLCAFRTDIRICSSLLLSRLVSDCESFRQRAATEAGLLDTIIIFLRDPYGDLHEKHPKLPTQSDFLPVQPFHPLSSVERLALLNCVLAYMHSTLESFLTLYSSHCYIGLQSIFQREIALMNQYGLFLHLPVQLRYLLCFTYSLQGAQQAEKPGLRLLWRLKFYVL